MLSWLTIISREFAECKCKDIDCRFCERQKERLPGFIWDRFLTQRFFYAMGWLEDKTYLPKGVAWECLMKAEERAKERASSIWKLCQGEDLWWCRNQSDLGLSIIPDSP